MNNTSIKMLIKSDSNLIDQTTIIFAGAIT